MLSQEFNNGSTNLFSFRGLAGIWNRVSEFVLHSGLIPVAGSAEAAIVSVLGRSTQGYLRIVTARNTYTFPSTAPPSNPDDHIAEIRVMNDVFWLRLCAMGTLGFAEAYMFGDVDCDDLVPVFRVLIDNQDAISLDSKLSYLYTLPQKFLAYPIVNTIANSRANISAHYDIPNDIFAAFLSEDMNYSCAIFQDPDGDLKNETNADLGMQSTQFEDTLHQAQIRKMELIIRKANILPGHRVLETGVGWGSLAILIAQTIPGTKIDGITISVEQQMLTRERIRLAGLEDRITIHLMDYREMPGEWKGLFDRVLCLEMIEHVGPDHLSTYWSQLDWALKDKSGTGVAQLTTLRVADHENYNRDTDFIPKWVLFPGGFIPRLSFLIQALDIGSKGRLTVNSVTNMGGVQYARTLREWRKKFLDAYDTTITPALQMRYPEVMAGPGGREALEIFKRKWIYYFCYCEIGYLRRIIGGQIISFARQNCNDTEVIRLN